MELTVTLGPLQAKLLKKLAELSELPQEALVVAAINGYLDRALDEAQKRNEEIANHCAAEATDPKMAEELRREVYDPILLCLAEDV